MASQPIINGTHRRFVGLFILSGVLISSAFLPLGHAAFTTAITPDGTLGTTVTQVGTVYDINGGTIKGSNLFHSFGLFSVGTGDTASFNGPNGIANILSRVTWGQQSMIDGTLRTTISGANLYLLNPAGVIFGPNAFLDVSGSFHVSTADYLRLADGKQFLAKPDPASDALLTSAPPVAFGFLSSNPAPISIQGSFLQVPDGQTLSVIGGDITIEGKDGFGAALIANSGLINIASVASPGEVIPIQSAPGQPPGLNVEAFTRLGQIKILQDPLFQAPSIVDVGSDVSGNGSGTVLIRGGSLQIDNSTVTAATLGDLDGALLGIDVRVTGSLMLTNFAGIQTTTQFGAGHGGKVFLSADNLQLDNSTISSGSFFGVGQAGDIKIEVAQLSLTNGSFIDSRTNSVAITGSAGQIVINTGALQVESGGRIISQSQGAGRGGDIKVNATGQVSISNKSSGLFANALGSGTGGNIDLRAGGVQMTDGATISAQSTGTGPAGNISIGKDAPVDTLVMQSSSITTESAQNGGGSIEIHTGRMVQLTDSKITTSVHGGGGDAGNIMIDPQFVILQGSQVLAQAFGGNGGNIRIVAGVFFADPNSRVDASSTRGIDGTVDIQAPVTNLSGTLAPLPSEIVQAAALLQARCAARLAGGTSGSFVVAGRDGLPVEPGTLLPSPLYEPGVLAAWIGSVGDRLSVRPVKEDPLQVQENALRHGQTGELMASIKECAK